MGSLAKQLSGKIGNVIFYDRNGKWCIRSRATRVRQTKATKAAAVLFGKAAKMGKTLRSGLNDILPDSRERKMMYRMNKSLLLWLQSSRPKSFELNLPFIDHFQFNQDSDLKEKIKLPIVIDWKKRGKVIVHFPETDILKVVTSPKDTVAIYVEIAITGCKVSDGSSTGRYFTSIEISEQSPAPSKVELPFQLKNEFLTIVVAAVKFERSKNGYSAIAPEKRWLPLAVIGSCYGKPE